ncbi:MAG: hypothetical protein IPP71_06685 [Bacteroidetes bacterium]|nr:hypothetical protein [Bacteroidota bacterium]
MIFKFQLCIFIIANILLGKTSFSQTYLIPGALQQPSWVFPIFIEDAIGQKDTVFIGYDGTYGEIFTCYDEGVLMRKNTNLIVSLVHLTRLYVKVLIQ